MAAAAFLIAPHQHVLNTSMKQRFLPTIDVRLGTSLMHASSCTHPCDHFVSTLTVGECGLRSASVALRPGLRLKCILITLHTQLINSIIHTLAVMKSKPFWVHTSTGSLYVFVHQEQSKQVSMSATVNRLCTVTRQSGGPLLHPTIT